MDAKYEQRAPPVLDRRAFLGGVAVAALPLAPSAFGPAARADEPSTETRSEKAGRLPGIILRQKNPDKAATYT